MISKFKRFIAENNLIKPADRVLLAVSGGIDSMVMAHLFKESGYEYGLAHCNFSLREEESDEDVEFVQNYSFANNVPFFSIRFDTKEYANSNKLSVQMAARELRYNWFEKIRAENNYDSIAVAHNLNDNTETLLINLTRGTGITGLTGMRPSNNRVIRPLLFAERKQIMEYCGEHKIKYREDKSNSETKYTRNKIRHLVIPILREINPSIEETLNVSAARFSEVNEIVTEYANELRTRLSIMNEDKTIFNINLLEPFLYNRTILYEIFRIYGLSGLLLKDLINVINGRTGGKLITPTHIFSKNRQEIIVYPGFKEEDLNFLVDNFIAFKMAPGIKSARSLTIGPGYKIPHDPHFACLDIQKITYPVLIRNWKTGDYFYPFGMKGKKKLSDYFVDRKKSIPEKEKTLVIEIAGEIAWIIGERIDNRYRITKDTKKVLILQSS